jgi:hypothetical protein
MPGKTSNVATARIWRQMKGKSDLKISPKEISGGVTDFK